MIHKITLVFTFLLFNTLYSQTTFEWETATDNGNNLTETIDGITVTTSFTDVEIEDAGGYKGSTAYVAGTRTLNTLATFTFSEPVIVNSILALEGGGSSPEYTFTPSGGSNSVVTATLISGGLSVTLNWTDITSFTVSCSPAVSLGFDNLLINDASTLSSQDFYSEKNEIKLFPNPSSEYITVSGLKNKEDYEIYNLLGAKIRKGKVDVNDKIDIKSLTNGVYFVKFENGNTIKFSKD